ncbi:MAG TPA: hypothetical protein VF589_10100 [Allosphingosinicella sp.]|jgi:hypothetical protein
MEDPLDGHTDGLIALLDLRARYVAQQVADRYKPKVARRYLPEFMALHRQFTGALRRGALVEAPAIEDRIFALSQAAGLSNDSWASRRLLKAAWVVAAELGIGQRLVDFMLRRQRYDPVAESFGGIIGREYLQPEITDTIARALPDAESPRTEAGLKRRYLAMLSEGQRVGYKSAQALLRKAVAGRPAA